MPQAVGVKRPPYRGEVEDLEEKEDVHPNHDGQTLPGVGEGLPVSPAPQQPAQQVHEPDADVDLHVVAVVKLDGGQVVDVLQIEQEKGQQDEGQASNIPRTQHPAY